MYVRRQVERALSAKARSSPGSKKTEQLKTPPVLAAKSRDTAQRANGEFSSYI